MLYFFSLLSSLVGDGGVGGGGDVAVVQRCVALHYLHGTQKTSRERGGTKIDYIVWTMTVGVCVDRSL